MYNKKSRNRGCLLTVRPVSARQTHRGDTQTYPSCSSCMMNLTWSRRGGRRGRHRSHPPVSLQPWAQVERAYRAQDATRRRQYSSPHHRAVRCVGPPWEKTKVVMCPIQSNTPRSGLNVALPPKTTLLEAKRRSLIALARCIPCRQLRVRSSG